MNIERRISLSFFESVLHKKHKKVTLISEIQDCFEYFDSTTSKVLDDYPIILIHGNGIELKRVPDKKVYAVDMGGVVKIVGKDNISKDEQITIVRKIRNITIPYANHVAQKQRNAR